MQRVIFDGDRWRQTARLVRFEESYDMKNLSFDDYPHVAPFLASENFVSFPVYSPTFCFSSTAAVNILYMQEIKATLSRLDNFIWRNNLNQNPCLISQAGAQSTMRLASKAQLRSDWSTSVEIPFCLHITEKGSCSRMLDYEDLYKQAQWLVIFEEVLTPLDRMEDSKFSIIAPHQSNKVVRNALMKSRRQRTKYSKLSAETNSNSSGYGSF